MSEKEKCSKCGNEAYAVARDMKSTRRCKCGHTWLPKPQKLTDWEVGQSLIAISDLMGERISEFEHTHEEIWFVLDKMRALIGDELEKLNSHKFGIYSSADRNARFNPSNAERTEK